jgi:hypothetical protein
MITFKEYLTEAKDPNEKVIARLEALNSRFNRYAHRWGEKTSSRMLTWVDEYNDLKASNKEAWAKYCKKNGLTTGHNAYDCLA